MTLELVNRRIVYPMLTHCSFVGFDVSVVFIALTCGPLDGNSLQQ